MGRAIDRPDSGYAGYLSEAAARWPDRVALRFEGADWTYHDLLTAVRTTAAHLAAAGVVPGKRIAILIGNRPEYLITQFALAWLGAVFVTPNPHWTPGEVAQTLETSSADGAVYDAQFGDIVAELEIRVAVETLGRTAQEPPPLAIVDWDEPLYIPFSSGTTGLPKAVLHTSSSMCGAVTQLTGHLGLTAADRIPLALPLCHIFGATMAAAAMSTGCELTLFRRFDLEESLRHIKAGGATVWPMAGAVAYQLAQRDDLRPEDFRQVRFFMWGGSAVPTALAAAITARTGVGFLCSYGMTEAMMVAFNPVHDPDAWRLDSPGFPTGGTELRIRDDGELEVRGPSVAAGYAGTTSAAFLADGWFKTGDLATIDDDGRLMIVDRIKDMIKVSGFQVAPVEVEQALTGHSAVIEAAVVGRADERHGEIPVAFVVTSSTVTAEQFDDYLSTVLATYKRPREYRFVDALPRTAGGKLQRTALRQQVASADA